MDDLDKIHETLESSLSNLKLSRDNALSQEIAQVKQVNQVLQTVSQSLDRSSSNVEAMKNATKSGNDLLDIWVKILSQTEHTNELLNNTQWQGATKDEEQEKDRIAQRQKIAELKRLQEEERERQKELEAKRQKDVQKSSQRQRVPRRTYGVPRKTQH